jgi:hypothetical protein
MSPRYDDVSSGRADADPSRNPTLLSERLIVVQAVEAAVRRVSPDGIFGTELSPDDSSDEGSQRAQMIQVCGMSSHGRLEASRMVGLALRARTPAEAQLHRRATQRAR